MMRVEIATRVTTLISRSIEGRESLNTYSTAITIARLSEVDGLDHGFLETFEYFRV